MLRSSFLCFIQSDLLLRSIFISTIAATDPPHILTASVIGSSRLSVLLSSVHNCSLNATEQCVPPLSGVFAACCVRRQRFHRQCKGQHQNNDTYCTHFIHICDGGQSEWRRIKNKRDARARINHREQSIDAMRAEQQKDRPHINIIRTKPISISKAIYHR